MEDAEKALIKEIGKMKSEVVSDDELQKCKNKAESTVTFSETDVLTKATNLAISELLGDADLINREIEKYAAVTKEQIMEQANIVLDENNCSTLYYMAKKQ
jgi:predicted Zn-dependent peptidase